MDIHSSFAGKALVMVDLAIKILRSGRPLPTDIYYSILEEGIDVQYLINLIEAEDSNATNETYLSHWDS